MLNLAGFSNKSFQSHVSVPVQDLIGVMIQDFLYRSWADMYNFPVKNLKEQPRIDKKCSVLIHIGSCTGNETWAINLALFGF